MGKRKVIIGIDGAPFSLMQELAEQQVMPFLRSLAGDGVFRPMCSSVPAVSSVSWSSIVTGCNPGEHGIYGFSDMLPGTYTIRYPNFLDLKRPPFWQHETGSCAIINVPSTYPAQPLQGCHVSGFVSPRLDRAVYPSSELEALQRLDYRVDLDAEKAKQSELLLYRQLYETHAKREQLADYLWEQYDPAVFMLVVTGSDRIGHFGWHHWQDPDHPSHDKFLEYFRRVDGTVERIAKRLNPEDTLVILSDHGMEGAALEVNLNAYLIDGGFLKLDQDEARKYDRIQEGSAAFALENGRVYVNETGRFPRGSVKPAQQEQVLERLTEFLRQVQIEGEDVIGQVHRREQIYCGDSVDAAPHLVAVPRPSFSLVGRLTADLHQPSRLPGMHNDRAFLLVRHPRAEEIVPETPTVEDVVSIIRH
ncbi:MAG: alkaline phosphatase family protein [Armatimonadota bacterium]